MALRRNTKAQSSLELLITLAFGLVILLPIVVLAFIQISNSSSTLSTTDAQAAAQKLASVAVTVGAEGPPAKQLVLIQVPQSVTDIYVGTTSGTIGHEIIFVINTNAGPSYVTAYSPLNISGSLSADLNPGVYLINVSAQASCPNYPALPCAYIATT
jgi:uncharacterized protein (UPF0333 family)